jgi:hypothetical protein
VRGQRRAASPTMASYVFRLHFCSRVAPRLVEHRSVLAGTTLVFANTTLHTSTRDFVIPGRASLREPGIHNHLCSRWPTTSTFSPARNTARSISA